MSQIGQLSAILEQDGSNGTRAQAGKTVIEQTIIVAIGMPGDVPSANAGVVQREEQVRAKLSALGLTPPAKGTLTFAQVGSLTAIFVQQGSPEAEQKARAMTVLGIN